MDEIDSCASKSFRRVVCDQMTKQTAPVCSRSAPHQETILFRSPVKSEYEISPSADLQKQIIVTKPKSIPIDEPVTTEVGVIFDEHWHDLGRLQTQYIANLHFQHKFLFDSRHNQTGVLCNYLGLRNGDQLLMINNEDVTLVSNEEVVKLLQSSLRTDTINSLIYWTSQPDQVVNVEFTPDISHGECMVKEQVTETIVPKDTWRRSKCAVAVSQRNTSKFMQSCQHVLQFTNLESTKQNQKLEDLHDCHFIEDHKFIVIDKKREIVKRYMDETNSLFLCVSEAGNILLQDTYTELQTVPANKKAFFVFKDHTSGRMMKVEGQDGKFVYVQNTNNIEYLPDWFKFWIYKNIDCM